MTSDVNVLWRKGDGEMPEKVQRIVNAAQDELLLRSLQLPIDAVDTIRYNAGKNSQTASILLVIKCFGLLKVMLREVRRQFSVFVKYRPTKISFRKSFAISQICPM